MAATSLAAAGEGSEPVASADPPNVVLILIDDMGWKDLESYGGGVFRTPNMDRIGEGGIRFTDAYASCSVCAPTRASLMTGRDPGRLHFTALTGHEKSLGNVEKNPTGIKLIQPAIEAEDGLRGPETTLPKVLREHGYRTALFGKTHFGSGHENLGELGFDVAEEPRCDMWITPPAIVEEDPKRMTTITDKAIAFIDDAIERDRPFFVYVSHNAVHVQVQATREAYEAAEARMTEEEKERYSIHYVAMVDELDREVGRLLDHLEARGVADDTLVLFTSDNGGVEEVITRDPYKLTVNDPLRGQKAGQYEGSHRVPLMAQWPGRIPAGRESPEPAITMDLFPTILEAAGLPLRPDAHLDGVSLWPVLAGETDGIDREALFWHKPHYYVRNPPMSSVRIGDWVYLHYWEEALSPFGGRPHELFDLSEDLGQTTNLAAERPEVVARLRAALLEHLEAIDAEIPRINPDFRPRSQR
jgi:arylsulfatase A-like enzyme